MKTPLITWNKVTLYEALSQHRLGNFRKAGYVCPSYEIFRTAVFFRGLVGILVNVNL